MKISQLKEQSKIYLPKKKQFSDHSKFGHISLSQDKLMYVHTANGGMFYFAGKTEVVKISEGEYEIVDY